MRNKVIDSQPIGMEALERKHPKLAVFLYMVIGIVVLYGLISWFIMRKQLNDERWINGIMRQRLEQSFILIKTDEKTTSDIINLLDGREVSSCE